MNPFSDGNHCKPGIWIHLESIADPVLRHNQAKHWTSIYLYSGRIPREIETVISFHVDKVRLSRPLIG